MLFYLDNFDLYDYLFGKILSKNAFFAELDVPVPTANFKIRLYDFYVIQHQFTFAELREANTKKLYQAIKFLKNENRDRIKEAIIMAEREKQSLSDFLIGVSGQEPKICQHEPIEEHFKRCKKCGKKLAD